VQVGRELGDCRLRALFRELARDRARDAGLRDAARGAEDAHGEDQDGEKPAGPQHAIDLLRFERLTPRRW